MRQRICLLVLLFSSTLLGGGCATAPPTAIDNPRITQPVFSRERMVLDDVEAPLEVPDPWEATNRRIYWANSQLDNWVLNPAVTGYRWVMPDFAEQGVTNFFDNLDDIRTLLNQALQLKFGGAWDTSRRFVTNTTVGLLGTIDVASRLNIRKHDEDFGQTLGHYGVADGPYVMLPLFGPSTFRGAVGRGVDLLALNFLDPVDLDDHPDRGYPYYPLLILDTRATTAFQYFETGSPLEYELVRLLFVTKRQLDVAK